MNRIALPPDIDLYPIEARNSRDIAERLAEKAGVIVSVFRRGERTTVRVRGNHELTETAIVTKGAVIGFISRTIDKYRELYGDGPA